jgi:hypothetical protein
MLAASEFGVHLLSEKSSAEGKRIALLKKKAEIKNCTSILVAYLVPLNT